jgi:hypothetical protein
MEEEIHKAASIIARRFANLVSFLLLEEEKVSCERQGYRIAREVIQELATFKAK